MGGRLFDGWLCQTPGTHFERYIHGSTFRTVGGHLYDALEKVLSDPVDDKPIGCQQAEAALLFYGLEWTNPGVEMLFRQVTLELLYASVPKGYGHLSGSPL
jgi:hypothetical protein